MKLSRYKHSSPVSYAFGATLCLELLKTRPDTIKRVFLRPNTNHGQDLNRILKELAERHIEIIESPKPFNILSAKDSCLLIAEFTKFTTTLDATKNHLVLANPSDAGNLGTIIRTAAAMNFNNLAIIEPAVDHFNPKVVRATMGAIFHLNIEYFPNFETYTKKYPRPCFAFMLDAKSQPAENFIDAKAPYSLVFGNEATGLPDSFANTCQPVILRQSNQVDSLNLSVAASIAMYLFKQ